MPDSQIYYKLTVSRKKYWKIYLLSLLLLGLFIFLYFFVGFKNIVGFVLVIGGIICLLTIEFKHFIGDKFYIADYGISKTTGVFSKSYSDFNYKDILRTTVTQSFMKGILNYGDMYIDIAGMEESEMVLKNIPNPLKYKKFIDDMVDLLNKKRKVN